VSGPHLVPPVSLGDRDRLRVLLVEDDPDDTFLVRELLAEARAPVELTVARTLAEARDRIRGVDCVLLDLRLPDATGLDALREVLAIAQPARPTAGPAQPTAGPLQSAAGRALPTAVCVLTGIEDEQLGVAAVAVGAQDYLTKGQVDGVVLTRALRYAVERKRAQEGARRLREFELRQAESARLERGLLPQPLMSMPAVALHSFYRAGRHRGLLGGDFYDAVQTAPHALDLMVGDVCGHGVDEAALGVELRVAWRALMLAGVADDAVLPAMEEVLISERAREEIFATVATVRADLGAGRLTLRLAGHPPPILIRDGTVAALTRGTASAGGSASAGGDVVLGVIRHATRTATEIDLGTRDWALLMYTDGLIEGRTGVADDRLEITGLCDLLARALREGVALEELHGWLIGRAEEANSGPLADDVAMLLLAPDGES
jgi:serine phosphatase RsbU (regulator of sigma subunit)